MTEKLKPCPFCGSNVILIHSTKEMIYQIRCGRCGSNSSYFINKYHAINAWNRRVNNDV